MNCKSKLLWVCLSLCVFLQVRAEEQVGNNEWRARMQSMLKEVLVLFPFAFNDAQYNDIKNQNSIDQSLKSLVEHSEGLKKHTSRIKKEDGLKIDPSFSFIAEAFENELHSAQVNFKKTGRQHTEAQNYLRSALSKCILCHSQSANGPELKLSQFKKAFAELSPKDRFMAYAATRQFDDALKVFDVILKESRAQDKENLDPNIKTALAIAVRVKKDPKKTSQIVEEVANSGAGSSILKNDLKDWRKAAIAWQTEKAKAPTTDQALFDEATRLIDSQKKKENSFENIENSDISLLRATTYLHDLLTDYPKSRLRAESYLLLASTYDRLPGFAMWDFADEYLGACIEENPHTSIGEKCFTQYRENIIVGYSGSSGTDIPHAVSEHLARMKALAAPLEPVK